MDAAKIAILFDHLPPGADPDDPDERSLLLDPDRTLGPARAAVREVIATQIADEDPPEVWATAQRLRDLGLDRADIVSQLSLAFAGETQRLLSTREHFDPEAYRAVLERLPLPTGVDVTAAVNEVVRAHPGVTLQAATDAALDHLGADRGDGLARGLVEHLLDDLLDAEELTLLAGDRLAHGPSVVSGSVLTHRLSREERDAGHLDVDFDLAPFAGGDELRLAGGEEIELDIDEAGRAAWVGPEGWLDALEAPGVLAVEVDVGGVVTLTWLGEEPSPDPDLVAKVRAAYDAEVAEPGLPVDGEELIFGVLLDDPAAFSRPQASLDLLCRRAGLERRGDEVAHDEEVWSRAQQVVRQARTLGYFEDDDEAGRAALLVLRVADDPAPGPGDVRRALAALGDTDVFAFVTDELLETGDGVGDPVTARRFAERAVAAAGRRPEVATARLLAAVVAERTGQVALAADHVAAALDADPDDEAAIDRAAWYASDRGDAGTAARLWERLGASPRVEQDLDTVAPFARLHGSVPGRNEPCWCGSGRKFKHCHRTGNALPPLPDRVGWLCRKAIGYLERRGRAVQGPIAGAALARAVDPDDLGSVTEAFEDPLVLDVVLTEGGWFERFLAERGALLPDDEALLGAAWALVPRTLYEVEDVRPGAGITLRDLGAAERVEVTERTLSRTVAPGQVICARAVPDGAGHQLVGGVFPVAPGTESEVLAACDEGRGEDLCAYVARLHRPPDTRTREGERLVACTAVVRVPDPAAARHLLDATYRAEGDGWQEWHDLDEDESILRAGIRLAGDELTVETHSEERVERVLGVLADGLGELERLRDERVPWGPGEPPQPAGGRPPLAADGGADVTDPEVVAGIQDHHEQRWIAEPVPALGGLTPRQAADDPTHREDVRRLLATFPDPETLPAGMFAMRPARLRALLGLDGG
jgi:hypothetical protein